MLHFRMNMPFVLMAFYGSLMLIIVLFARALLKNRLPKFVFPALWCLVLIRLLVPFSLSSPLSIKITEDSPLAIPLKYTYAFIENMSIDSIAITSGDTASTALYEGLPFQISAASDAAASDTAATDAGEENVIEEPRISQVSQGSAVSTAYSDGIYTGYREIHLLPRHVSLPVIYFTGLLITVGILLFQKYRYSSKLKNRLLIEHNETINTILREMNMGHILVFTNDEIASPLVCGLFTPRIYLPTRMDFGNQELLRHILTHETMHIKRKDNWIKTAMLAALCLNWFNPLIWLMSKCLSRDLEAACDEAVLIQYNNEDERKSYAFSLLSMAITGNRTTLLYSAFSKTEVERRIKNILNYKKASALLITAAALFMLCFSIAFTTAVAAPFSSSLTGFCSSSNSKWGVRVEITRDISLGKMPGKRAADIVFDILGADTTNDPEIMEALIKNALSEEFHVEKSAFLLDFGLCLSDEDKEKEYETWNITKDNKGYFIYKGEPVRVYIDETGGFYQSSQEGLVDIIVHRNRYGDISNIEALHHGDSDFDRRTRDNERSQAYNYGIEGGDAVNEAVTVSYDNAYY